MSHRLERHSVSLIDRLRDAVSPDTRAYLHGITPVVLTALVAFGVTSNAVAAIIAGAALATLDLLFALIHSTNAWRSALYAFAAALQPIGIGIGIGTDTQWVAVLAILSAVLGSGVAAAKTPTFRL